MVDLKIKDLSIANFEANLESNRETIRVIHRGLSQYNARKRPDPSAAPLTLAIHDQQNQVIGGLLGRTAYGWLRIDAVWVHETFRGLGYGSSLLEQAEQIAMDRGCHSIHLDTYGFQAPDFYKTHGYEIFGELPRYPDEDDHYYFKKSLTERP
ncbi:MAG: GNAT family N-acetyltransferase [Gammaproteobacteria bacterium]|nr:GNAT family N-acetyltransferase [Gammaproteobacteria bacterium]MCZ6853553.1 GNAT family N-acetyltransferase [Gammaproteobacteria bacterium]